MLYAVVMGEITTLCLKNVFTFKLFVTMLYMYLNVKKSACIHIGPRFNVNCCNIVTIEGHELAWINVVRYLGISVQSLSCFKCFFNSAKCSFYRLFNAVFGNIGPVASHEVTLQLLK